MSEKTPDFPIHFDDAQAGPYPAATTGGESE
jgi:hypothetical protein